MRRLALVALAAVLVLAACRGGGDGADIEGVDPVALLAAAAERTEQARSFHFVLEHENGTTEIVRGLLMERAEGDVAGSDRVRMEVRASFGPLNLDIGIVVIGDEGWITNPLTRRWEREQITLGDVFDPAKGIAAVMRSVSGPTIDGVEDIDGVATYRVVAQIDSGAVTLFGDPTPGRTLQARAWIGVEQPLVYRLELVGGVAAGEPDDLVRRITLSRFDEDPEIVPPR